MNAIVCELCGSNDIVKQDGFFVCQHCGTKYSAEEAKKLIVSVQVDNTEKADNLLQVARRAHQQGDYKNAEKCYSELLTMMPNSWEANYYSIQSQVMQCRVGEIAVAAGMLKNAAVTSLRLINNDANLSKTEKEAAVVELGNSVMSTADMLIASEGDYYRGIAFEIQSQYKDEFFNTEDACIQCLASFAQTVYTSFPMEGKYKAVVETCWKKIISIYDVLKTYGRKLYCQNEKAKYEQQLAVLDSPIDANANSNAANSTSNSTQSKSTVTYKSPQEKLRNNILKITYWIVISAVLIALMYSSFKDMAKYSFDVLPTFDKRAIVFVIIIVIYAVIRIIHLITLSVGLSKEIKRGKEITAKSKSKKK